MLGLILDEHNELLYRFGAYAENQPIHADMKKSILKKLFSFDIADWMEDSPSYEGDYAFDKQANASTNIQKHLDRTKTAYDETIVVGHDLDYSTSAQNGNVLRDILRKAKKVKYIIYDASKESLANQELSKVFPGVEGAFEVIVVKQEKFNQALDSVAHEFNDALAFHILKKNQKNNHWMIFKNQGNPVAMWVETEHLPGKEIADECYFLTSKKLESNQDYQLYKNMTNSLI